MCGLPCSGKSTRALALKQFLLTHNPSLQITIINEESLQADKHTLYKSDNAEKKFRGALLSACNRYLSKEAVLIVDSMNYIKGVRYQLFTIAREVGTPHCVVSSS